MKTTVLLLIGVIVHLCGISQERDWKVQKSKDGLVIVKSEVVDGKNAQGEEIKIMYYVAERVGKITLNQAETYLRNSDNYKTIWESTLESREIRKISEDEWVSYYLFSSIWPMPKSDCVQHLQFIKENDNGFKIIAKAIQDETIKSKVERLTIFDVTYDFEKVTEDEVKLMLTVSTSPIINAPKFLFRAWFPKGPAGIVNRIFENAAKETD